jgi:hypothetical protein
VGPGWKGSPGSAHHHLTIAKRRARLVPVKEKMKERRRFRTEAWLAAASKWNAEATKAEAAHEATCPTCSDGSWCEVGKVLSDASFDADYELTCAKKAMRRINHVPMTGEALAIHQERTAEGVIRAQRAELANGARLLGKELVAETEADIVETENAIVDRKARRIFKKVVED